MYNFSKEANIEVKLGKRAENKFVGCVANNTS